MVRSRRKTLAIHVKRESGVEVRAPLRASQAEIERFVISRAPWIEKHLLRFNAMPEFSGPDLHFGGHAWVLGEEWKLAPLGNGSGDDQQIELKLAWNASEADFQKALDQWYTREASAWFEQRHQYWRRRMAALDLPDSFVTVRKMRRRWGSARRSGKLVFNTALLKYPPECIDCVVVHELCHLVHFNHSPAFYRLMSEVMPEWKEADARLCELALRY
ncbi:Protein of unknown function DUF45 [gamma proteobacterium HdN1]|nr:Protein of unknown function DUF45 [gamma proteobacterium HdN1]